MEASLLSTKLNIPPARPHLVLRSRLMEKLQGGLGCNLMLVSAPAGFGKTTLLAEWARQNHAEMRVVWVSLDESENDPVRFWDYFIAALETLQPKVGERALALLHSPQPLPADSVLLTLINDIAEIPGDFTLVLDDYQFVKNQPIHNAITLLIEHLPPRAHLVIATRADPPLPLALFRGRGIMAEIDADDLRFTLEEAASLLEKMRGPEISLEAVSALNMRTEGWAVGLKMAAMSLRRQRDIPGFITSFTGSQSYIMDYLLEEVLQQQPEDIKDFLLKTSVLEGLKAPLCDAVTGRTDSRAMLFTIERANLFIVSLDESREWYRYEHLFAELLRHQLGISSSAEVVSELHRRASRWYEDNGFPNEAIQHSLSAGDWERALRFLYSASERYKKTGELVTLLNWLKVLPIEELRTHQQLYYDYGLALLYTFQHDAAEAVFCDLEQAVQTDSRMLGKIIACRALIASYRMDIPLTIKLSRQARPLLSAADVDARCSLSLNMGKVLWERGLFNEAEPLLNEAYETGRRGGYLAIAQTALAFLSNIVQTRGQLLRAVELNQQAIALGPEAPGAAVPHFHLAVIHYEWNELEKATYYLDKASALSRLLGTPEMSFIIPWYQMLIRLARRDQAGAQEALGRIDQSAAKIGSIGSQAFQAGCHLQIALAQGDLAQAIIWGDRAAEYGDVLLINFGLLVVRLLIARGQKGNVQEQLRKFYKSIKTEYLSPEWRTWLVTARVCLALAAPTPEPALSSLAEALSLARPQGLVRTFVDEGTLLIPLLREAILHGIEPEYAARLLAIIEVEKLPMLKGQSDSAPGFLSGRELEVVRLLNGGLSDRQIAAKLFIGLSTTKTHLRHIFEKLHAQSRTEALARARELKLI